MHIKPKKKLGQNFLVDKNIQNKIIASCGFHPSDIVLEIGAGRGELTRLISQQVDRLYALEIDLDLYKFLKDNFRDNKEVKIINRDVLKLNLQNYFSRIKGKIKVVGNIPYYITTPIIDHLIKGRIKIDSIFITVQKEFAQRMTSQPGSKDYGSFSCFVQYYTEPKQLFYIKNTSFLPKPKVDSCFLLLRIRQQPAVNTTDEKLFFQIIRAAFNQRRKILKNSLLGIVGREKLARFFSDYSIDSNIRPEDLALQEFANLTNI